MMRFRGICSVLVLAACAVATFVAAALPARAETPNEPAATAEQAQEPTVSVAGMNVAVDPETGHIRPLTPAEQRKLAAAMKKQFGVKAHQPVAHADGMLSTVVGTEFLSYSVGRLAADGSVERECAAGLEAAVDFLSFETAAAPAAVAASSADPDREER
jgi:hypothetical protein